MPLPFSSFPNSSVVSFGMSILHYSLHLTPAMYTSLFSYQRRSPSNAFAPTNSDSSTGKSTPHPRPPRRTTDDVIASQLEAASADHHTSQRRKPCSSQCPYATTLQMQLRVEEGSAEVRGLARADRQRL